MKIYISLCLCVLFFTNCKNNEKGSTTTPVVNETIAESKPKAYIDKPFKTVDIPFITKTISPLKKQVIKFSDRTTIEIEKNSFVDANGTVITEDVDLSFREFNDALDIYLSGIPMEMNLNNQDYHLESEAMFELKGSLNGTPVFINPEKPLKVAVNTVETAKEYKIIKLDVEKENWIIKADATQRINEASLDFSGLKKTVAPVKPLPLKKGNYSFTIDLPNRELYPELSGFENTVYQIHESDTAYNPEDTKILWSGFKLKHTKMKGVYSISFYNRKKTVTYLVEPAYNGKDFKKAMKTYNKVLRKQKLILKKQKEAFVKRQEEAQIERIKSGKVDLTKELTKTFAINEFGVFNSDRLFKYEGETVVLFLMDETQTRLNGSYVMVYEDFNNVYKCKSREKVKLIKNETVSIWMTKNDIFYHTTFNTSKKRNTDSDTLKIQLKQIKKKIRSPKDLRKVLGIINAP